MKPMQKELTDWAIDRIKKYFINDIALLIAIEGHSMEDDCHGLCFDYFVPVNENGNKLAQTFIIDGVGHDLYPRSWTRIEAMADFNDDFTFGLGEAIILYARSEEDRNRFYQMQLRQKANMENPHFMYQKALEKLDIAMELYRNLMFEDTIYKVRLASGFIAYYLSVAVANINGVYFKQRLDLETVELKQMTSVPENFIFYYEAIIKSSSAEEMKKLAHLLIRTTRDFLNQHKPVFDPRHHEIIYEDLAAWYEEGSLTWRRIYAHCDSANYQRAYADGIRLQFELNSIRDEFGLKEMDLLGSFDHQNLTLFKAQAKALENYIISEIETNGIHIHSYETLDEFLAKNS